MNVCLLNDSFPPVIDGVANVVMNYAKIMQEQKMANVLVGTPRYPDTDYSVYPYQVIPYKSFDTTKLIKGYRAGNPFDTGEIADMAAFSPDIIHSHCPVASTIISRVLRNKTDAPIVFTYHTKFDIDIAKAVKGKLIRKTTIQALVSNISACDEVWVVSEGAGENLKSLGFKGDYRVVSNGVDFAKGRVGDEEVKRATKGYDLPEGVPVFLFVGRIIDYKGLPMIVDALDKLNASGQDFRMVFVGSGPDEERLKRQTEKAGLYSQNENGVTIGKCIFTGPIYDRDTLRAWNTRADLFLFPSTYDTNGIVVREAAACGLASVLIQGSCAAEGITDGRNGYLIDENSVSLMMLLKKVCKNLDKVHTTGQAAMDEIYISWEDSVHSAHERYGEIIELKKSGKLEKEKPMLTEKFLQASIDLVENTDEIFHLPQRVFQEMYANVEFKITDMKQSIVTNIEDLAEMGEFFKIREIEEEIRKEKAAKDKRTRF